MPRRPVGRPTTATAPTRIHSSTTSSATPTSSAWAKTITWLAPRCIAPRGWSSFTPRIWSTGSSPPIALTAGRTSSLDRTSSSCRTTRWSMDKVSGLPSSAITTANSMSSPTSTATACNSSSASRPTDLGSIAPWVDTSTTSASGACHHPSRQRHGRRSPCLQD